MSKLFFFLTVLIFVSACGQVEEVQNKTNDMAETTEEMNTKISETNKNMGEVLRVSKDALRMVRPGSAMEARNFALTLMNYSTSIPAKISYAAKYFYAFEYQHWTPELDTLERREELKGIAAQEFFKEIRQFMVTPLQPFSNEEAGLFALSATLHEKEFFQIKTAQEADVPETSMLDIIEEGLRSKELVNKGLLQGDKATLATLSVLQNEEQAVKIIQTRQNFLLLVALSEAWGLGERWITQIWKTFWLESGYAIMRWPIELRLETKNLTQLQWQNRYLRASLEARKLLLDLGYPANLDKGMLKLNLAYVYSKINPVQNREVFAALSAPMKSEISTYARLLEYVRMSDEDFRQQIE